MNPCGHFETSPFIYLFPIFNPTHPSYLKIHVDIHKIKTKTPRLRLDQTTSNSQTTWPNHLTNLNKCCSSISPRSAASTPRARPPSGPAVGSPHQRNPIRRVHPTGDSLEKEYFVKTNHIGTYWDHVFYWKILGKLMSVVGRSTKCVSLGPPLFLQRLLINDETYVARLLSTKTGFQEMTSWGAKPYDENLAVTAVSVGFGLQKKKVWASRMNSKQNSSAINVCIENMDQKRVSRKNTPKPPPTGWPWNYLRRDLVICRLKNHLPDRPWPAIEPASEAVSMPVLPVGISLQTPHKKPLRG